MKEKIYDTTVIGSGPAGLTAAIYASRGKLATLVILGSQMGGQLMLTTDVEDFPGFPEIVQGPELILRMKSQAERLGAEFTNGDVTNVDVSKKQFTVVGGGDAAIKETLFLAKFASEVQVVHRRDSLRAFPVLQERAFNTKNIKFVWNSTVEEVLGKEKVEGIKIKNVKSRKTNSLKLDGVFVAIGHKPNTEFLKGKVDLDKKGYISLKGKSKTSVEGVFAAG